MTENSWCVFTLIKLIPKSDSVPNNIPLLAMSNDVIFQNPQPTQGSLKAKNEGKFLESWSYKFNGSPTLTFYALSTIFMTGFPRLRRWKRNRNRLDNRIIKAREALHDKFDALFCMRQKNEKKTKIIYRSLKISRKLLYS